MSQVNTTNHPHQVNSGQYRQHTGSQNNNNPQLQYLPLTNYPEYSLGIASTGTSISQGTSFSGPGYTQQPLQYGRGSTSSSFSAVSATPLTGSIVHFPDPQQSSNLSYPVLAPIKNGGTTAFNENINNNNNNMQHPYDPLTGGMDFSRSKSDTYLNPGDPRHPVMGAPVLPQGVYPVYHTGIQKPFVPQVGISLNPNLGGSSHQSQQVSQGQKTVTEKELEVLKSLLPGLELHKWKYLSHRISKMRSKKFTPDFVRNKTHDFFSLPQGRSQNSKVNSPEKERPQGSEIEEGESASEKNSKLGMHCIEGLLGVSVVYLTHPNMISPPTMFGTNGANNTYAKGTTGPYNIMTPIPGGIQGPSGSSGMSHNNTGMNATNEYGL